MPSTVALQSLEAGENLTAIATLTGIASGAISFVAATTPDVDAATFVPADGAGLGPYTITLPAPVGYFVWVRQNGQIAPEPLAVWLRGQDLTEIGKEIQKRLTDNVPMIEAAMKDGDYQPRIKQVVYGFGGLLDDWPGIVILRPRVSSVWEFAPNGLHHTYSFMILFLERHSDVQSEMVAVGNGARALQTILNKSAYRKMTTASGLRVVNCHSAETSLEESMFEDLGFEVAGTIEWKGEAWTQDAT